MNSFDRRAFLGTSFSTIATSCLLGQEKAEPVIPKHIEGPLFQPNTLFLTWQRDPTRTMTIQWIGSRGETSDTTIYYTPFKENKSPKNEKSEVPQKPSPWKSQPSNTKPYPFTDLKIFRCELTQLEPNTEYQFRIGKVSPTYRFKTMPAKATDTIHFISGGDVSVNPHAIANNIAAAQQDPMFTLIGGDLGYDNGTSVEISLAFIRNYSKHMIGKNGRLIPLVTCIGNHEVDGGYHQPREKAPFFYSLFDGLYPEKGYTTLEFGDYLSLVLLDTGHTTRVEGEQADWLDKTLKARVDHPNVMVVNHVPAYPAYLPTAPKFDNQLDGSGAPNRKHWVPLFEKHRVPIVLEHHDHCFKRSRPLIDGSSNANGVVYLGDGSWGRLRSAGEKVEIPHIAATSDEYHMTLHRLQGEERFHLAINEHGKVMDFSRTAQRKKGVFRTTAEPGDK
ncbi:metallophosphoesterase family protein [Telmatocola sphagniphila]|uniref:Metallophosphoesterase family protein n=1 Tax=Telmatocola sphagniphila TaxID=1123043 RepID=A0A8E6B892_9BACT|nr:metallophosphoesterase family protein [Telmatocola sphagniphila]QVL33571.1 metallophosphoesterase family protein [Telmatocola sphagniphila]